MYVDRRLAGIQAVQTLSRLNRAYPGKDTTYVLDFVNSSEEVLAAFKTYYDTAELEGITDPNLVYDLRAKLDASGNYDAFEVNRVVAVEMNPMAKQGDLIAALEPVADRLLKRFKQAQEKLRTARAKKDDKAAEEANGEINALILFKADIGAFQRMYSFLSQIFDYGNTDIEKRFMFYRRLIPLLEFGREREGIDLSKMKLTHHTLKDQGKRQLPLGDGEAPKLPPLSEAGSGSLHEKEKALLAEIIAKVNDLFEGDLTDDDQLVYVNNVIKGKLLESEELVLQASNNTKAQFANPTEPYPEWVTKFRHFYREFPNILASRFQRALNAQEDHDGYADLSKLIDARIGAAKASFISVSGGPGSAQYRNNLLIASSCRAHSCDDTDLLIVVDIAGRQVFVALKDGASPPLIVPQGVDWPTGARLELTAFQRKWRR